MLCNVLHAVTQPQHKAQDELQSPMNACAWLVVLVQCSVYSGLFPSCILACQNKALPCSLCLSLQSPEMHSSLANCPYLLSDAGALLSYDVMSGYTFLAITAS